MISRAEVVTDADRPKVRKALADSGYYEVGCWPTHERWNHEDGTTVRLLAPDGEPVSLLVYPPGGTDSPTAPPARIVGLYDAKWSGTNPPAPRKRRKRSN